MTKTFLNVFVFKVKQPYCKHLNFRQKILEKTHKKIIRLCLKL